MAIERELWEDYECFKCIQKIIETHYLRFNLSQDLIKSRLFSILDYNRGLTHFMFLNVNIQ